MTTASNSLAEIPHDAKLRDYQRYIAEVEVQRGFSKQTALEKCLLLGEEVGELFKAVRKQQHIGVDPTSNITSVQEELADVFIFLCAIANRYGINLDEAFREKETVNKTRQWVTHAETSK